MKSFKRILTALILLTLLALLSACVHSPSGPTELTYGLTLAPSGIDPHIHASSELGIPLSSVYDTLVCRDPESGIFVPGLAEEWTISADGLHYTFSLRDDVIFHDGTPFNAEAVEANIAYTINPDHHSFKAALMLGPLDKIEVIDEFTVALHLTEPFAPLLDSLSQVYLGMASPQALTKWGPTEYQFHQVGTGPYKFEEYIPNDHLTLTRNPDYAWAPSIYNQAQASIDTIIFRFYEDPATRAIALESGEIDIVGEVPPHDADRLAQQAGFNLYPVPIPGQPSQFFFNTRLEPTSDLRVRQALSMAVDRSKIISTIFHDQSPVADGPLAANTFGYTDQHPYPTYDMAGANALLTQAGWVDDDGDGIRSRNGDPLDLTIVAPPWGSNSEIAQLIRSDWEELGARVTLEVAPGFGPLKEIQTSGEYHAIGINFFDSDPDLLRSFFSSTGFYNWSLVEDERLDELLIQASQETLDTDLRLALYDQVFERIRDQALVLPIRDYINLVVTSSRLQGLRFSEQGWFPFLIDLRLAP
jgi:peptide/nickel transport system substrate-binding protein